MEMGSRGEGGRVRARVGWMVSGAGKGRRGGCERGEEGAVASAEGGGEGGKQKGRCACPGCVGCMIWVRIRATSCNKFQAEYDDGPDTRAIELFGLR